VKRIHVNQNVIRHNKKYGNKLPPIRIEDTDTKEVVYCHDVKMLGVSNLVYKPDEPLPCGAKLWIETYFEVAALGICKYSDIAKQMEETMTTDAAFQAQTINWTQMREKLSQTLTAEARQHFRRALLVSLLMSPFMVLSQTGLRCERDWCSCGSDL